MEPNDAAGLLPPHWQGSQWRRCGATVPDVVVDAWLNVVVGSEGWRTTRR